MHLLHIEGNFKELHAEEPHYHVKGRVFHKVREDSDVVVFEHSKHWENSGDSHYSKYAVYNSKEANQDREASKRSFASVKLFGEHDGQVSKNYQLDGLECEGVNHIDLCKQDVARVLCAAPALEDHA